MATTDASVSESSATSSGSRTPLPPLIESLRAKLVSKLTDTSRNNPLLYYRRTASRQELGALDSSLISDLVAGQLVTGRRIAAEVQDTDDPKRDQGTELADPITKTLKAIKAKARENAEERGIDTLFAGLGMLSWKAEDGGRDPLAPLLLLPVQVVDNPARRGEYAVKRAENVDVVINPTLFEALPPNVAVSLRTFMDEETVDDVDAAFAAIAQVMSAHSEMEVSGRCVLANFSFQLMAMVQDLKRADAVLSSHPIVRAIAGDEEARIELIAERDHVIGVDELDAIPSRDESLVLDADPWQAQAIHTLLRFGNSNAVIDGPPGTGKSQTIANAIASLVAAGQTVLFVAEKRAALDVVYKRLSAVGLGTLVLDLHGGDVTRKKAYEKVRVAERTLKEAPPANDVDLHRAFDAARDRLNAHARFINEPLPGCGMSPIQVMGRLSALSADTEVPILFTPAERDRLGLEDVASIRGLLAEAAAHPDLFQRTPGLPWSQAGFTSDDAAQIAVTAVSTILRELRFARRQLAVLVPEGPSPTVSELIGRCVFVQDASAVLGVFRTSVSELDTSTLDRAINATSSPFSWIGKLFSPAQRAAEAQMRTHLFSLDATRSEISAALRALRSLPVPWRAALPRLNPELGSRLQESVIAIQQAREQLRGVFPQQLPEDMDSCVQVLSEMEAAKLSAYRVFRIRAIERELQALGLAPFLRELFEAKIAPQRWDAAFERMWLSSHIENIMPTLATFDGRLHDALVEDFREYDQARIAVASRRILRGVGERYVSGARDAQKEYAAVEVQLNRQRKMKPLRDMYAEAPKALTRICPCVMASPLTVSQFLPCTQLFDIVIFDEGSQVSPETAITSILRGRRLVVAGDVHQLPPTSFFKAVTEDDEDDVDESSMEGVESILDTVRPFFTSLGLRVHYRSRDEHLIAFSNHHIYDDRLVTFPGTGKDGKAVSNAIVPPSQSEGDEKSSSAEVMRVVELVLEHAEERPQESLGVICMNIKHAQRVQTTLDIARKERPELDGFFNETTQEPFFVKNLERVQGDERDAIILTVGYGRTKTGAVSHNFGPVNVTGGERRLNVAVTRAKNRIITVSSFCAKDLDPQKLRSKGARLLGAYLKYAESGGEDLGRDRPHEDIALNDFEADIKVTLEREVGMSIVPQFGVGEFRIDLAVQHPDKPGSYIMAIECDGASYHSSPTARMRDLLRQQILEGLGWRFLRIWSTDWFHSRTEEIARAQRAYREALVLADEEAAAPQHSRPAPANTDLVGPPEFASRKGRCPVTRGYSSIDEVAGSTLGALLAWIESDQRLRTDEELMNEAMQLLGFARRGKKIVERLSSAIMRHRRTPAP